MTNATEFQGNVVLASDIVSIFHDQHFFGSLHSLNLNLVFQNPFDMSYHFIQHAFDSEVMSTLSKISNLTIKIITTPLVTDLLAYKFNPDVWIVEQIVNGSSEISSTSMVLTSELPNSVEYSTGIETFRYMLYNFPPSLAWMSHSSSHIGPYIPIYCSSKTSLGKNKIIFCFGSFKF